MARLSLLIEYGAERVALAVYLAASMHEAIDDLYRLGLRPGPGELHARFLGWLTRSRETDPLAALRAAQSAQR